jgi:VWFA-related protein
VSRWLVGVCLLCALALPATQAQQAPSDEPRQTDLVETTERRLIQVDVTVEGPRDAIVDMTREDFELKLGLKKVREFILDNLCVLPDESPGQEVEVIVEERARPARPGTNFLFYFDQHHLTMGGRARSIDVAQRLIADLIADGNQAMIVSAGKDLRTFSEMTGDVAQLDRALRELNGDRRQWEPWVEQESTRIGDVIEILEDEVDTVGRAIQVARGYQREERWRTEKALHLFSMVLGHMAELDPPKVAIYFADTMRSNAGDHYLSFFSRMSADTHGDQAEVKALARASAFSAAHAFDRVLEEATAMGIRVYTIEARGMTAIPNNSLAAEPVAGWSSPLANSQPVKDAQNSMVAMAMETRGRAFLNGVRARKITARIRQDLSCVYLISFDGSHLWKDTTHRVVVKTTRPDVKLHARGQIRIQSESRRLSSRLMAAFASPQTMESRLPVHGIVIPTGYEKGEYAALVQLHVPGSSLPTTSWDLGLSLISRGEVAADVSGRVSVNEPRVPVVLEQEMRFRPGPFKLVGVVHETTADDMGTGEVESNWPDPDDSEVTLGPVALMQPTPAAILRDEVLRSEGSVGIPEGGLARTDRSTVLVGIVCRAKGTKRELRVERTLLGDAESFAPFGPLKLEFGDDRCAQIQDYIPAGSMSSGMFSYEIRVLDKKEELASTVRQFAAASPEDHPGLTAPRRD